MMLDVPLMIQSLPSLLHGAILTLQISCGACLIGFFFGTLLGLMEDSSYLPVRLLPYFYVTLFRGTPMLVQILFVFYVLPQMGLSLPPIAAATLAIGLNSAAYISQIVRAGIRSVPIGQLEAAQTLGLSRWVTTKTIVLPQALSTVLPALGNEWITLIKDSSLASMIGVMELTKEASLIRSRTYDAFSILVFAAILYLFLTTTLSLFIKFLEKKQAR